MKVTRDVRHLNQSLINVVANPVVCMMHVLHCALVFRMLHDLQGRLVVEKEGRRSRHVIPNVLKEVPHPHYLTPDLGSNHVFQLHGG